MAREHSPEYWQTAREYYVANDLSMEEFSRQSAQILGQHTDLDQLKKRVAKEHWDMLRKERKREEGGPQDDITAEVDDIRRILYQQIKLDSTQGLTLTGDFDKTVVLRALKGIPGLKIIEAKRNSINAGVVTAYMNLLDKAKYNLKTPNASAKTSLEKAMDIAAEEAEKMRQEIISNAA